MIGIDEVGRGCWAGPLLVVAARETGVLPLRLKDSKLLSRKTRELFFSDIKLTCDIGEGWVTASEIDELGLSRAMYLAVERSLQAIGATDDEVIIIDGNINYCPKQFRLSKAIINADATHPLVSAASIYAKVLRDNYMTTQAEIYPGYSFETNVGYGTASHSLGLKTQGICNLHRQSYKPIQAFIL